MSGKSTARTKRSLETMIKMSQLAYMCHMLSQVFLVVTSRDFSQCICTGRALSNLN